MQGGRPKIYMLSIATSNILAKVNFMLNSHGIWAVVAEGYDKFFYRRPEIAGWIEHLQFAMGFKLMKEYL